MSTDPLADLSKADWQFIYMSVFDRFSKSDAKPGEPANSKAYKEEKNRIMTALMRKAYPAGG